MTNHYYHYLLKIFIKIYTLIHYFLKELVFKIHFYFYFLILLLLLLLLLPLLLSYYFRFLRKVVIFYLNFLEVQRYSKCLRFGQILFLHYYFRFLRKVVIFYLNFLEVQKCSKCLHFDQTY